MQLTLILTLGALSALGLSLVSLGQPNLVPVDRTLPDASVDQEPESFCILSYTDANASTTPDYEIPYGFVQVNIISGDCSSGNFCTWDIIARYDIKATGAGNTDEVRTWHKGNKVTGSVDWSITGGGGSFVKPDGSGGFVPDTNPGSEGHVRLTGQGPNCGSSSTFTARTVDGNSTVSITIATSCSSEVPLRVPARAQLIHGGGEENGSKRCH